MQLRCWIHIALGIALLSASPLPATAQSDDWMMQHINEAIKAKGYQNAFGWLTGVFKRRTEEHFEARRYEQAFVLAHFAATAHETIEIDEVGTAGLITADAYGQLSWYGLAAHKFEEALTAAEKSVAIHFTIGIEANRAHALALSSREGEARAIYLTHRGRRSLRTGTPWRALLDGNFTALEKLGLSHKLFAEIRQAMAADEVAAVDLGAMLKEGEELYNDGKMQEALAIAERCLALAPESLRVVQLAGDTYRALGRYSEAEPLYRRSLLLTEARYGRSSQDAAISLAELAGILVGRGEETEPILKRAAAIFDAYGEQFASFPQWASVLTNLGGLYTNLGRATEAEETLQRSLKVARETVWPGQPDNEIVAESLRLLGALYSKVGRYSDAEELLKQALAIVDRTQLKLGRVYEEGVIEESRPLGQASLRSGPIYGELGDLYWSLSRYPEAESMYQRSLESANALGVDHPAVGFSQSRLGILFARQQNWDRALHHLQNAADLLTRRVVRQRESLLVTGKSKADSFRFLFELLVRVQYRQPAKEVLAWSAFEMAQWAQGSDAGDSLFEMASRSAKGNPILSGLVRERQDLVALWRAHDKKMIEAGFSSSSIVKDLASIEQRIREIDRRLASDFPEFAALADPKPLSLPEIQALLKSDEVLVFFLSTPKWQPFAEESFIWVVSRAAARWARIELGASALTREVAALRCGLDAARWDDQAAVPHCGDLLKTEPQRDTDGNVRTETLPFDAIRAHALYKALFGQVEDIIADKHLLIVPSGPLTQLPFHVLVTAATASNDHGTTRWLARSNASTVLPAVSSLKALRRVAKASAATKPMVGIGNPLLDGYPTERPWEAKWAELAKQKQACPQTLWQRVAGLINRPRGAAKVAIRGGHPDLTELRTLPPLHDTADELCAVAKDLKLASDDILLGAKATETTLKGLNLAQYRVLHFATHGIVAGEITGTSEPGLVLTPPQQQTELDDGYLSASEVAALKLDADWVILSACNTAAGGAQGAEALSGLARAFIYAGARALLVSHWSVDSAATVKLITGAVGAITRDAKLGRAEALRHAMLALIDKGEPRESHPAYWAPFVVVGEGASH